MTEKRAFADLTDGDAGKHVSFYDAGSRCQREGRLMRTRRRAQPGGVAHLRFGRSGRAAYSTGLGRFAAQEDDVFWSLLMPTRLPDTFGPDAEDALSLEYLYSETLVRLEG